MNFDFYAYVVIPVLIFVARIFDVSLGTIRIILVAKGLRKIAPIIGFFEVFIWVLAISKIIENLDNWICYFAYAGGFATGNYIGMKIEEKLALGHELIRVITKRDAKDLVNELQCKGFGVTFVNAEGTKGEVGVVYIIVTRKKMNEAINIIKSNNPNSIYTIEDIRFVNRDVFFAPVNQKEKLKKGFVRK
ncbi:MAG: DUF2179 domain-containing protein [Salinivirgaceae bacterium]|nr:DUF2179 domain-containing protein [Salinivirgaceae bacterium]